MFDSFHEHEDEFNKWKSSGLFLGTKDETKEFIENLIDKYRKVRLWPHQEEAVLRIIYSYEVLGKKNLLTNIVTGGGKTVIIGAIIAWLKMAYKANKFLILTPNLIVKDRLKIDFDRSKETVFQKYKLFPPHHEQYANQLTLSVIESGSGATGALDSEIILSNIHQFYQTSITGQKEYCLSNE